MRFVRTILAIAIAASLALLPAGASASGFAATAGHGAMAMQADSSGDMTAGHMTADMAMDECCPHTKAKPGEAGGKCPLGFCVAPCIGLSDDAGLRVDFPPVSRLAMPIPADQVTSLRLGSPPFRPPRV